MKRCLVLLAMVVAVAFVAGTVSLAQTAPATVILKGAPLGGVKLDHKTHSALTKCDTCHHASKPEKPTKAANQKCTDCHTKVAAAPMKTKLQAAFHDPLAKKGTCINCHTEGLKAGKKPPTKCTECHKKENV